MATPLLPAAACGSGPLRSPTALPSPAAPAPWGQPTASIDHPCPLPVPALPAVWRFLFFSGRIATSLLVHQDYHAGSMNVTLDPNRRGVGPRTPGCKQVPLEKLEACWSIKPLSGCMEEAQPLLPPLNPDAMGEH